MLKINGVTVRTPSSFQVDIQDLDSDNTKRSADGQLHRDRVGVKRTLQCTWKHLSQAQMSTLLNAMTAVFFTVTYPDPQAGVTTKTFYVSDRNAPMYNYALDRWENLSLSFIER